MESAVTGAGHLLPSYLLSFISLQLQSALLAIQFNLSLIFAAPTCSEATTLSFPPFTPFSALLPATCFHTPHLINFVCI